MTVEAESPTITSADGTPLVGRLWRADRPRGSLAIAHGLGEHSGCYAHVASRLAGPPCRLDVLGFDFRGHGRSPGRRGVVRRFDDLTQDLLAATAWLRASRPGSPPFVLGHSNGGQVALRATLQEPAAFAGLVLSNPLLALRARAPAWKLGLGRILRSTAPWVTLSAGLNEAQMVRDSAGHPARQADPLRHGRISAPLYFGMIEGGARLLAEANTVRVPLLILLGESDPVVDPSTARAFFERAGSPDKTLHAYPGALHEPLNDVERARVLADLEAWLDERLPAPG